MRRNMTLIFKDKAKECTKTNSISSLNHIGKKINNTATFQI